jgi:hypothetical protein
MADPTPPLCLPNLVPHEVTQDSPFNGSNIDSLPVLPDLSLDDRTSNDTAAAITMLGCDNKRLKACTGAASVSVWGIREMFLAQLNTVYRLLHPMHQNHLAVIQRTGAGKTHILWTLGVIEWGIMLIFIPLLVLSANVKSKFTCADQRFGAVIVQHLDKLYDANKRAYQELLGRSCTLFPSTTTKIFLFLSPQFLVNHPDAHDIFIDCLHCMILQVVVLDKEHIHVQHVTSFCRKIYMLQANFFSKIFGNNPEMRRPQVIALTGTMPDEYLPILSNLLTINLFTGDSLVCGLPSDFSQREIEMRSHITLNKGQYVSKGLTYVLKFLQENPALSAVVFCNSCKQSQHYRDNLEQKLNKMKLNIDVIHINGSLHKIDKF